MVLYARRRQVRMSAAVVVVALVAVLTVLLAGPAAAVVDPRPAGATTTRGSNTDLVLTALGPGQAVQGGLPGPNQGYAPLDGYPSAPSPGYVTENPGFAGVIIGTTSPGNQQVLLYCIDMRTDTYIGVGYTAGTWNQTNVPLVGYVAYILQKYYPKTGQPTTAPDDPTRAAAVQSAVWWFTDGFVLTPDDPVRPLTAAIVADATANGPLVEPQPTLTITPGSLQGPAGSLVGPFTVNAGTGVAVTVESSGGTMYTDAAGHTPLPQGASVTNGTKIWLRAASPGASSVTLSATGEARVPSGGVFLYDGHTSGLDNAQKIILAQDATVTVTASATAQLHDTGALVVTKTIAGAAAGHQGSVTIGVTCGTQKLPDFTVPAGATGSVSHRYDGIPTPTTCTVTETADGADAAVSVVVTHGKQTVSLPANSTVDDPVSATPIVNTYEYQPGSLLVTKTVTGPAAGQQGAVHLQVTCSDGTAKGIDIPAGTTAPAPVTVSPLPAGTTCHVTEDADGSTATTQVAVALPGPATIPAGGQATLVVTDTFTATPVAPVTPVVPVTPVTPVAPVTQYGSLAATGSDSVVPLLVGGLATLALGVVLVLVGRTRRTG